MIRHTVAKKIPDQAVITNIINNLFAEKYDTTFNHKPNFVVS